jgi:hypothetical protein
MELMLRDGRGAARLCSVEQGAWSVEKIPSGAEQWSGEQENGALTEARRAQR